MFGFFRKGSEAFRPRRVRSRQRRAHTGRPADPERPVRGKEAAIEARTVSNAGNRTHDIDPIGFIPVVVS